MKEFSRCARAELGVDAMMAGKVWCYAPVTCGSYWGLGTAVANEPGYHPIPLHWANIEMGPGAYDTMAAHANALNTERGVTEHESWHIIASTMKKEVKR